MRFDTKLEKNTLWVIILCMALGWVSPVLSNAQNNVYKIVCGDEQYEFVNEPYENDRGLMVNAKELCDALGFSYDYDETYASFEIFSDDGSIMLMHEATHYYKGDESINCEPSFYVENGPWVEMGFFCSAVKLEYSYDSEKKVIDVLKTADEESNNSYQGLDSGSSAAASGGGGNSASGGGWGGGMVSGPAVSQSPGTASGTYTAVVELESAAAAEGVELEYIIMPVHMAKADYYGSPYYEMGQEWTVGEIGLEEGESIKSFDFVTYDRYDGYYEKYCVYVRLVINNLEKGIFYLSKDGETKCTSYIPNHNGTYDSLRIYDYGEAADGEYYIPAEYCMTKTISGSITIPSPAPEGGLDLTLILQEIGPVSTTYYGVRYYKTGYKCELVTLHYEEGESVKQYETVVSSRYYDNYCLYIASGANPFIDELSFLNTDGATSSVGEFLTEPPEDKVQNLYLLPFSEDSTVNIKVSPQISEAISGNITLSSPAPEGGLHLMLLLQEVGTVRSTNYGVDYYATGSIYGAVTLYYEEGEESKPYEIILGDYYRDNYSDYQNYCLYVETKDNWTADTGVVNSDGQVTGIRGIPHQIRVDENYSFFPFTQSRCLDIAFAQKLQDCGENAVWSYDADTRTLTISGEGDMYDYDMEWHSDLDGNSFLRPTVGWLRHIDDIERVVVEEGIVRIGNNAFSNHFALKELELGCEIIGENAFYNSRGGLQRVNISDIGAWCGIEFMNQSSNPLSEGAQLYVNGELLERLVIPEGITKINDYAFCGSTGIITAEIPDSVTRIGAEAFGNCGNLVRVTMPAELEEIGAGAFDFCESLVNIDIPQGVEVIEPYTFRYCSMLSGISIPDSVKKIAESAFYGCKKLSKVHIADVGAWCGIEFTDDTSNPLAEGAQLYVNGEPLERLVIPEGITKINDYAFCGCTGITELIIPEGVLEIGCGAFSYGSNIHKVQLPVTLRRLGANAFLSTPVDDVHIEDIGAWCKTEFEDHRANPLNRGGSLYVNSKKVESLVIPDGITKIRANAFYGCESITAVTLPEELLIIDEKAFYNCYNLKNVVIPKGICYIKNYGFEGCYSLETVLFTGGEEEWGEVLIFGGNDYIESAQKLYNVQKRTYRLVTNCENELSDIKAYGIITEPYVKNFPMKLVGWYDNKELSGSPVAFPYYGPCDTLYASWTERSGESIKDAFTAEANSSYVVKPAASRKQIYYELIPVYSGVYTIYSQGDEYIYGCLYDAEGCQITGNSYGGEESNFKIVYTLEAGNTYYIGVENRYGSGEFTLCIETDCYPSVKAICTEAVTGEKIFTCMPRNLPCDCRIILVCYKNKEPVAVQMAYNTNEDRYFVVREDFTAARIMVWEDFASMRPVTEAVDVEIK